MALSISSGALRGGTRRLAGRRRERIGFAFSGGGPLGALQVGALLALFEHGIEPDVVVGSSVGALNAAMIAFDPSPDGARTLERIWRNLRDEDLFPGPGRAAWARWLLPGDRVFDNSGLAALIERELWPGATFEDAILPLGIVTTALDTGEEVVFRSGPVREPLLASCALPSIFPPVRIGDRLYIDGGVADNVPIGPAVDLGATTVYVMDSTSHSHQRRPLERPMDYLLHAFTLARSQRLELDVKHYSERAKLVMVPAPPLERYVPLASTRYTSELIARSYEVVGDFLEGGSAVRRRGLTVPAR